MADDARAFAIDLLVVCTANQARSPVAELLFSREADKRLGPDHGFVVRSAGVHAPSGASVLSTMDAALDRRGLSVDYHRSRPLRVEELEATRLVITMTEEHRRDVNRRAPSLVGRTFTLREVDRLVSSPQWDGAWDGADDAIERLPRLRPLVPKPDRREDVIDPAGHSVGIALAVLDELTDRIGRISAHLFGELPVEASA
jgi:protein-tyrosine phosphatase